MWAKPSRWKDWCGQRPGDREGRGSVGTFGGGVMGAAEMSIWVFWARSHSEQVPRKEVKGK